MKRKSKKNQVPHEEVSCISNKGRTSQSMLKYTVSVSAMCIALLYISIQNSENKKYSEKLITKHLRKQINNWINKKINITTENNIHTVNSENVIRLLDNCATDSVSTSEISDDETYQLFQILGFKKVQFTSESWCRKYLSIESIEGWWDKSGLNGISNITYTDGRFAIGQFHKGAIWGEMKTYRCIFGTCNDWEEEDEQDVTVAEYLESVVRYVGGRPDKTHRSLWFPVGGGILQCFPDPDGLADGDNCVYLYPDYETALIGLWKSGRMVSTVEAKLVGLYLENDHLQLEVGKVKMKEKVKYRLDVSTSTVISATPLIEDPFEEKIVYVAESIIENAGEGLFLKKNVASGDLVAIYNGVRMSDHEARLRKEDRRSPYRIFGWNGEVLNIPSRFQTTETYTASLAHKANHAKNANAVFRMLDHPRFGECIGVYMIKEGAAGEEVYVDYGYVEKAMATEAGMDMLLDAAQMISGIKTKKEFKLEMKKAIGHIREKVGHLKPLISTLKLAQSFMS